MSAAKEPAATMNGAESLVRTLVGGGVDVTFTNPGTSEMHFVAALDRVDGMRCVLCLFEGVATGAADGYARMADKPAATLLHLGPGLGNAIANIHNAKKARQPMINIVGDHAIYHKRYDSPLTSDIETLARPMSHWVRTGASSRTVAEDGRDAIVAARRDPGEIATLILPADTAWGDGSGPVEVPTQRPPAKIDEAALLDCVKLLTHGKNTMLLIGGNGLRSKALEHASRIAAKTGCRLMAPGQNARVERGAGRVSIARTPYPIDQALKTFADVKHLVLIGAMHPVAFFAYPGKPSTTYPADTRVTTLAEPHHDLDDALARLADAVNATKEKPVHALRKLPMLPTNQTLDPVTIGAIVGALIPENAIVCDESVTTGRNFFATTEGSAPHDWLQMCGGAIGEGLPMAIGAAIACPDRKVISLEADGSGMYTLQALWTGARENLDVLTIIWANRAYRILRGELANVGAENPGRKAHDMLSLDNPALDWVSLAKGMGVPGIRVSTSDAFVAAFRAGIVHKGPYLIEVVIE
ncbi:MAG: acetolactate synthase large subunit [Hyphomicrobiaceae bacterium]